MKLYIKIALFAIFFIALSGIWIALHFYNLKHPDMAKTKPDFVVTASVLEKAFEHNETAASKKYINKIIEVTGTVASVKPAGNNVLTISLATGSDLSAVICTFTAVTDTSKFRTGDKINLRGECSGFLMDVLLNNCALIQ